MPNFMDKVCLNCGSAPTQHSSRCPRPKFIHGQDADAIVTVEDLRSSARGNFPCYCEDDCRCSQKFALQRLEQGLRKEVG